MDGPAWTGMKGTRLHCLMILLWRWIKTTWECGIFVLFMPPGCFQFLTKATSPLQQNTSELISSPRLNLRLCTSTLFNLKKMPLLRRLNNRCLLITPSSFGLAIFVLSPSRGRLLVLSWEYASRSFIVFFAPKLTSRKLVCIFPQDAGAGGIRYYMYSCPLSS